MSQLDDQERQRLQYLSTLFERHPDAMVVTDADNRIVEVNPAFSQITGFAAEAVVGQDPGMLSSGHTPPETYAEMWQALRSDGFWQGEFWDRRADDSIYPKSVSITVVRDASGTVTHHVAIFRDTSERKSAADQIFQLTHNDALTGLVNRTTVEGQLDQMLTSARRDGGLVAAILIDMDNFKQFNDTLGHAVGDRLLVEIASRLRQFVRASDVISRLGGDEFLIVAPDIEGAMSVSAIASKIRRGLSEPHQIDSHLLYATPTIGISLFPGDGDDAETLIRNAETAMYNAKSLGRDTFKFFAPTMNAAAHERLKLENALRLALEETTLQNAPQFRVHFQPQMDITTGRITRLEALARWQAPEFGLVPPSTFIQIAEETGLIQPLGDWIFWEACRQLRNFKEQGVTDMRVAVNLSTQQLRNENLPTVVRGALACYGLSPTELELEITESVAMHNPELTMAILGQLNELGIVLAIDDFGTGYSSLSYLKHLPIHRLKIDRSFVRDITSNHDDVAICSAIIVLGHELGLDIIAEGVETEPQRDYLKRLNCDLLQGFLYSKPLPAEEVVEFLRRWNTQFDD
ncbi:MAG: EAL domain-containing protein [Azonexus sp.]|jgi:diguanylate cyclase (GGDEF)-like protein/PAS domain S-box-containing protein|nr:EAL domain-containing protein [Azonexus sp.]